MNRRYATYVGKACAYVTRSTGEVLVFNGPGHEELQIPKGTIETEERPRDAVGREVREGTGLTKLAAVSPVATDVWTRRQYPPKRYVRHFFHARVEEPRDSWSHDVRDGGAEHGATFELQWMDPQPSTASRSISMRTSTPCHSRSVQTAPKLRTAHRPHRTSQVPRRFTDSSPTPGRLSDSSLSTTRVPRSMSTDAGDNGDGDMVKLNVKVPKRLLEEIDELADELEYTTRSEFIREVLRDTTEPILTPGAQEGVSEGYADVAAGRTMSTDEARERLDIDH
ncbi:hypothetical protein GCM10027435_02600 [Haloparvum alkalitolerans]